MSRQNFVLLILGLILISVFIFFYFYKVSPKFDNTPIDSGIATPTAEDKVITELQEFTPDTKTLDKKTQETVNKNLQSFKAPPKLEGEKPPTAQEISDSLTSIEP